MRMPATRFVLAAAAALSLASGGEIRFVAGPAAKQSGDKTLVSFAVNARTDVEVAILDARGKVVRHLAAGVLGGEDPPPHPLAAGLAQSLEWDGLDDYGKPVAGAQGLAVRVRAGMGVALERIAGGDPYAFYSREMGQGDHAAWRITGLEAKPDGSVYVMGNANNYGPPAIRQYDALGSYRRTVFPPPAGKPIEDVKGWGVYVREDGTYTPRYNDLSSPALSTTLISSTRGGCASLLPTPDRETLTLRGRSHELMAIGTDSTLREYRPEPAFSDPPIPKEGLFGPFFSAHAPDGKSMYVSGLFTGEGRYGSVLAVHTTGFWRDGQVWRVDLASRKASVFFALDEGQVIGDLGARGNSPIADSKSNPYAAFHGVAVDPAHNVLVCDRQNKRIVALDRSGKVIREIPVMYPDAIALHPKSRALFVTTRVGNYHKKGELKLLKFNDWTKDAEPAVTVPLCQVGTYPQRSFLAVCESRGDVVVWVAYTALPVRVYREAGGTLELVKDFYEAGPQRALDLQHITADPATDDVYVADGFGSCFKASGWEAPRFVRCMRDAQTPLAAIGLAIDTRHRRLYARSHMSAVLRYRMEGQWFPPDPVGETGSHAVTPRLCNDWRIGLGFGDRGLAAAPDGSLATLGAILNGRGDDYAGYLHFFPADAAKAPWQPLFFSRFGKGRFAGVRFDLQGNLYAGRYQDKPSNPPSGFEKDSHFLGSMGRIHKFAPTGPRAGGNLFPTEPIAPAKTYDVHYGAIGPVFARTPRFGLDGWGRLYYPTSLVPKVSVIDNNGNPVLGFGTYGNRDSLGGLPGDLVPTKDIPLAWPNSVDATDDYIYVGDIVNIRLLRIRKTFQLSASSALRPAEQPREPREGGETR